MCLMVINLKQDICQKFYLRHYVNWWVNFMFLVLQFFLSFIFIMIIFLSINLQFDSTVLILLNSKI